MKQNTTSIPKSFFKHSVHDSRFDAALCKHCGNQLDGYAVEGFCCIGCKAVYALLSDEGLQQYYALRRGPGMPVPATRTSADLTWLDLFEASAGDKPSQGLRRYDFDVQGMHCSGCVWLLETLFRRHAGALQLLCNPALGRLQLAVDNNFPLRDWIKDVERFGYKVGPALKVNQSASDGLLIRTGICIALAANAMMLSVAIYLGLRSGPLYEGFRTLNFVLASCSLAVGGPVFFKGAWQSLRQRVLHFDVPIALGVALSYTASAIGFFLRRPQADYLDTVSVFLALMLLGRWLQRRVIENNHQRLLASDGADGLWTRRIEGGHVKTIKARELSAHDELLWAPGDLLPIDSQLLDEHVLLSLDWINGESTPQLYRSGDSLPAGAFQRDASAVRVRALTSFAQSPLVELLRSPLYTEDAAQRGRWWRGLSSAYTVGAIASAVLGFLGWFWVRGDILRALDVTAAVLIVSCPCAFGLAAPLAYELVQLELRRYGVFIRRPRLLDRLLDVRRIVFDKTGTLTHGVLGLENTAPLLALSSEQRQILYNLAVRSAHPKSQCVAEALGACDVHFLPNLVVHEYSGKGIEWVQPAAESSGALAKSIYRLGRAEWATEGASITRQQSLVFTKNGETLAQLEIQEPLRADAAMELSALASVGYRIGILSGDRPSQVKRIARRLGVPFETALGSMTPAQKSAWLAKHADVPTLFIGDGLNDALAADNAYCSGTPAVDRPFMPARTDFYFTTAGLSPVRRALTAAHLLRRTIRQNLTFALIYNVLTIALAWAGLMRPWLAAVVMPLSSLSVIGWSLYALSSRRMRAASFTQEGFVDVSSERTRRFIQLAQSM